MIFGRRWEPAAHFCLGGVAAGSGFCLVSGQCGTVWDAWGTVSGQRGNGAGLVGDRCGTKVPQNPKKTCVSGGILPVIK